MIATFRKILIPVDFTVNTELALKKALGLIGQQEPEICLLHVLKIRTGKGAGKYILREAGRKLDQWKESIGETAPGIRIRTGILYNNSVEQAIAEYAKGQKPDLIIVGKTGKRHYRLFHRPLSPDRIARESNCPVLTIKPGCFHSETRIIVMPVRDFVPERKLELAILMARRYKASVHLLVIREEKEWNGEQSQPFLQAYRVLRENLHHSVEYYSIAKRNAVRATLNYAREVMADMILVNPETESGIRGFPGVRHISDLLNSQSKIQVLDVLPY